MDFFLESPEEVLADLLLHFPCRERQIRALLTLISINGASTRNIVVHGLKATGKTAVTEAAVENLSKFYDSRCSNIHSTFTNDRKTYDNNDNNKNNSSMDNNSNARNIFRYAVVKNDECIDARHFFEHTIGSICEALDIRGKSVGPLTNLSDFITHIQKLFESWLVAEEETQKFKRFILIFDRIDRPISTFSLPYHFTAALARIGEIVSNLTIIIIMTYPRPSFLNLPGVPHIYFPSYTKSEFLNIISLTEPNPSLFSPEDTSQTWSRFTAAVYDSLSKHSSRDIVSFRALCLRLWPVFIRPILSNELGVNPFSRLMLVNRSLFQNDDVLIQDIITSPSNEDTQTLTTTNFNSRRRQFVISNLPTYSRLLLTASYLASFTPNRNDTLLFTKSSTTKRRKKGGGTALSISQSGASKSRKIPRKLLGAQAFYLERMLAIFHAIFADSDIVNDDSGHRTASKKNVQLKSPTINTGIDVQVAIATLVSLRLLICTPNLQTTDVLNDGIRYRVGIGWDMARNVARSIGIEIENYLTD